MSYPVPEGSSRPSVRHTLPHRTLPRLRSDQIFYRIWDATKKFPLLPLTVDKEGMVAAVIWTHRVREAMSESLHRFDWGKNRLFFSRFDWFNSFKEVCVNPDFRVNQKGVRDVEQSNNSFENLVLAILQGSQRWQRSLNPLATLHQWDRPRLGRWHLHPAGRHNFYHSVDFSCFLRVSKLIQITAQMADESCPTGKSSERKCLILTLSARVSQSTRLGVLLVYWSAKVSSNHVLELYLT